MSVYKVERKVDTVIVEMDISVAEALLEVASKVEDLVGLNPIQTLAKALRDSGEIRYPSPLYEFYILGELRLRRPQSRVLREGICRLLRHAGQVRRYDKQALSVLLHMGLQGCR